jgi:hypothetical protein
LAASFLNPTNALTKGAATSSVRNGTGTSTFTLPNDDPSVYGVQLLYRKDDAVGAVLFRATSGSVYYEVELPKSDLAMKLQRLPLPPHESGFVKWDSFRITVPAGGTFELQQSTPCVWTLRGSTRQPSRSLPNADPARSLNAGLSRTPPG